MIFRDRLTPLAKVIVAHELTHALDDQRSDWSSVARRITKPSGAIVYQALVEGNATRIEREYLEDLPERQRVAVKRQLLELANRPLAPEL